MPAQLTYPGVYIEEIPSGVHTITGVATSIAAFLGRALRGPTDVATTINSYGDFERIFGGLWNESALGFAVRDFFINGGSQAIIVRLYKTDKGSNAKPSKAILTLGGDVALKAASEGSWGSKIKAKIDNNVSQDVAERMGLDQDDVLINLTVNDTGANVSEKILNLSLKDSPRRIDKVLEMESRLVRWGGESYPAEPPVLGEWSSNEKEASGGSDGLPLTIENFTENAEANKTGLYALEQADLFNILCIPPYLPDGNVDTALISEAAAYCEKRRTMLLVDPPRTWTSKESARSGVDNVGTRSKNAALFFPRLKQPNPLRNGLMEDFVPCGAVAGIFARTDTNRGVWKAPAGLDATLVGVPQLSVSLTDAENGELNPLGINCLRALPPAGRVIWGARTLQGDNRLASEWKFIPVRRTALFIEESLFRGLKWAVFEPNDAPLWAQIRLNAGSFMHSLFRQGAFQGSTPREAYFVKCDKETTTQNDIDSGIVNVVVGFAPLKPAEFVVIKIQQIAGQVQT